MQRWKSIHVGKRGDRLRIGNVRVWEEQWRWLDRRTVTLPHPLHTTETFPFMICEAGSPRESVRFAAGELGGGLWAFYVED